MKLFSDETLDVVGLQYEKNTLAHAGKKGMKWGITKEHGIDTGRLSKGKSILLGMYGNKARFTDPAALGLRKKAGKTRIAAIATHLAAVGIQQIGGRNPSTAAGANAVANILGLTAGGLAVAGAIQATKAISIQQKIDGS